MSRFRVPHTLVLLFGMIIAAFFLTRILPRGSYERVENEVGRMVVQADSFTYQPQNGPESWGGLSEEYALCGTGQKQSPIDLTGAGSERGTGGIG